MMNYCYKCGNKLEPKECVNCGISEGMVMYCDNCSEYRFPLFDTAVSSVIFNEDFSKTLLIRQYDLDWNIFVAGYVNKSENLQEAIVREIGEEVSLSVKKYIFNESCYYEKSNTLVSNFITVVDDENFTLTTEVDSACWYDVEKAKDIILQNSLAEYFYELALSKIDKMKNCMIELN